MKVGTPVLIVQGGTGAHAKDPSDREAMRRSLSAVLEAAYEHLLKTNAVEAVCLAVKLLEDDPLFNAGTGSQIQKDGKARLSAAVMDGEREIFSGVINLQKIRNPILVAKLLLDGPCNVLSDEGALQFALAHGFSEEDTTTPLSRKRWQEQKERASDTVGACAIDSVGRLASATSTGGIGLETPGRVSDSATPAGNFADAHGAVSATGVGEEIIHECLAAKIVTRVRDGLALDAAFDRTFREVRSKKRRMGAVAVDAAGNVAYETTSGTLAWAWKKGTDVKIF